MFEKIIKLVFALKNEMFLWLIILYEYLKTKNNIELKL